MVSNKNDNKYSTLDDLLKNKFSNDGFYSTTENIIKKFKKRASLVTIIGTFIFGISIAAFFDQINNKKNMYVDAIKTEANIYIDTEIEENVKNSVKNRIEKYDTLVDNFVTYKIDKALNRQLDSKIDASIDTYFLENESKILSRTEKLINEKINDEIKKYRIENNKLSGTYIASRKAMIGLKKPTFDVLAKNSEAGYNISNKNFINPDYKFLIHYNKASNLLTLYSITDDEVLITYNGIDGKGYGQKNDFNDNKTPEGLYKIEKIKDQRNRNEIPRLGSIQIKIDYPNKYETQRGFLGDGILIRSSDNINQIMAIDNGKDITNGDIVLKNDDLISLYRQIENHTGNVLVGIENKKIEFNFDNFMERQYESYKSN